MATHKIGDLLFESSCDLVDMTSANRPDPSWVFVDAQGHEHRWFTNGQPATSYDPQLSYEVPTLVWVVDGVEYWDGELHEVGHTECRLCGEHIAPRSTPDTCQQLVPGLRHFRINGQPVSKEEFERRAKEAGLR
jgi:hypothetical protein